MAERTLVIHAGGGKAGSSALQSALSRASENLANVGISYLDWYPRSSAYEITPGNGFRLFEAVGEPAWVNNGRETIEFYLGGNPVGICSSEFLGALTHKRWKSIIETASEIGVEIKIVYFVRSAVGYLTSSYNQNVKRSGEARPFAEAVVDYPWQHYDELQILDSIFDGDHLQVINYDRACTDMGGALGRAYTEIAAAGELLAEGGKLPVNRSLTGAELEVIRRINAQFGALYSHDISDRLIYAAPDVKGESVAASDVTKTLAGKFSDATQWINQRFFPDGDGLNFEDDQPARTKGTEDPIERPLRIALEWALDAIENRSTEITFVRERLLAIDWENSDSPKIPPDFDPIAYLLLNPDVLRAQLPPYLHFTESGQQEGRKYRWPLSMAASGEATTADAIKKFRLEEIERLAEEPTWPRLRHSIQLEALLHQFAGREHEYLELIRKLRETQGYETEKFKQGVGQLLQPLHELVEGVRRETIDERAQHSAEMQILTKLAEDLPAQVAALWEEQARLNATIERKDHDLAEQRDEFDELIRQKDAQLADMQVLMKLAQDLTTRVAALWNEQSRLNQTIERKDNDLAEQREGFNEMIRLKDAELADQRDYLMRKDEELAEQARQIVEQANQLGQYRNTGFIQYLKWGFQRSRRP